MIYTTFWKSESSRVLCHTSRSVCSDKDPPHQTPVDMVWRCDTPHSVTTNKARQMWLIWKFMYRMKLMSQWQLGSVPVTATIQIPMNYMHYCQIAVQMQVRGALEYKWI